MEHIREISAYVQDQLYGERALHDAFTAAYSQGAVDSLLVDDIKRQAQAVWDQNEHEVNGDDEKTRRDFIENASNHTEAAVRTRMHDTEARVGVCSHVDLFGPSICHSKDIDIAERMTMEYANQLVSGVEETEEKNGDGHASGAQASIFSADMFQRRCTSVQGNVSAEARFAFVWYLSMLHRENVKYDRVDVYVVKRMSKPGMNPNKDRFDQVKLSPAAMQLLDDEALSWRRRGRCNYTNASKLLTSEQKRWLNNFAGLVVACRAAQEDKDAHCVMPQLSNLRVCFTERAEAYSRVAPASGVVKIVIDKDLYSNDRTSKCRLVPDPEIRRTLGVDRPGAGVPYHLLLCDMHPYDPASCRQYNNKMRRAQMKKGQPVAVGVVDPAWMHAWFHGNLYRCFGGTGRSTAVMDVILPSTQPTALCEPTWRRVDMLEMDKGLIAHNICRTRRTMRYYDMYWSGVPPTLGRVSPLESPRNYDLPRVGPHKVLVVSLDAELMLQLASYVSGHAHPRREDLQIVECISGDVYDSELTISNRNIVRFLEWKDHDTLVHHQLDIHLDTQSRGATTMQVMYATLGALTSLHAFVSREIAIAHQATGDVQYIATEREIAYYEFPVVACLSGCMDSDLWDAIQATNPLLTIPRFDDTTVDIAYDLVYCGSATRTDIRAKLEAMPGLGASIVCVHDYQRCGDIATRALFSNTRA